jgi:hypothetical protein
MKKFFCNGKKDFCDKELCPHDCEFFTNSGGEYVSQMTNADRIRAMSDEELAVFLRTVEYDVEQFPFVQDWDKWLQQPAEGE